MRFILPIALLLILSSSTLIAQEYQLGKPIIQVEKSELFKKKASVSINFRLAGSQLRYTTDGSEPNASSDLYEKPIRIKNSSLIKAKAFKTGFLPSETVSTQLVALGRKIKSIEISPEPNKSYPGKGGSTLIDQVAGSLNFRDGNWLGYNAGPITITIDLGKDKKVNEILLSTLTSAGSWIMPPSAIKSMFSKNGIDFKETQILKTDPLTEHSSGGKTYYSLKQKIEKTRFVRLIIEPLENLPHWHAGSGNAAWVFLDEIIIK